MGNLPDFDKLWNYADPEATEARFREILPLAESSGDVAYLAQLLTQIARAQGLRDRFEEALATLDRANAITRDDMWLPQIRELLERGRVFNSWGKPEIAMRSFEAAWKLAELHHYPRYAVDAVHMLAIAAATPSEQIEWGLRGLAIVEKDPSQKRWLPALYNNLGESYAKAGMYREALEAFRQLGDDEYAIKDQSRMLRAMGQPAKALAIIEPLATNREKADGWISEEFAECLVVCGRADEATPHFAVAYELLSADPWVQRNDPQKLQRLKQMGQRR